jgi:two-component system, cell cycle sensor histidine kinase and response regulator CckA
MLSIATKILVVDDDPSVGRLIRSMLEGAGYEVVLAQSAEEARRIFASDGGSISLLLTDVVMPGQTGPELASNLLDSNPDLPVIFVSGYCETLDPELSHFACIPKPFFAKDVVNRVQAVLTAEARAS